MADCPISVMFPCAKCARIVPADGFYRDRARPNGLRRYCKECDAASSRALNKRLREEDGDRIRARANAWRKANPERVKELKRGHYDRHKAKVKKAATDYQKRNRERRREVQQVWRDNNREKVRDSQRRARTKLRSTPQGRLELAVRGLVRYHLKHGKGQRKTFEFLPYSVAELSAHLEKQFTDGMSWDNYGEWHVDHIIPVSVHNFLSPDDIDFQKAWALSNLQPLWASDNHRKSNSLTAPFQPSLALHGVD